MQKAITNKSNGDVEKEVAIMGKLLDKGKHQQIIERAYDFVKGWDNVETTPAVSMYWKYLGFAYFHVKDYNGSINCFGNATKLFPYDDEAYTGKGMAYIGAGRIELALKDFDIALDINPDNATTLILKGLAYASKGDSGLASEFITKAAAKDKKFTVGVCKNLIDSYYNNPKCTEFQRMELMKLKAQLK